MICWPPIASATPTSTTAKLSSTAVSGSAPSSSTLATQSSISDDCLKAGKRRELHQEIQPSANESAPCNPALQSTLGSSTNHAIRFMVSSIRGAGIPVVPAVYQTMYGNMVGPVRNPLIPVLVNTNQFANPVLRTPATPFLGTMFRTPVLQTMLPSHVPTPGAPFSRTVFGCLTNPDKSSGISLMTTAGTYKHPSQENEEISQLALNPENHPRAELATSSEQDLDPDSKHTTEALGIGDKN